MQNVCKFKPQYTELRTLKVRWEDLFLGGRMNIRGMSKEREQGGGGGYFQFPSCRGYRSFMEWPNNMRSII